MLENSCLWGFRVVTVGILPTPYCHLSALYCHRIRLAVIIPHLIVIILHLTVIIIDLSSASPKGDEPVSLTVTRCKLLLPFRGDGREVRNAKISLFATMPLQSHK